MLNIQDLKKQAMSDNAKAQYQLGVLFARQAPLVKCFSNSLLDTLSALKKHFTAEMRLKFNDIGEDEDSALKLFERAAQGGNKEAFNAISEIKERVQKRILNISQSTHLDTSQKMKETIPLQRKKDEIGQLIERLRVIHPPEQTYERD